MMRSRLISPDGLQISASGFDIEVRLPWYRTLPLSTVDVVEVRVDGQLVDPLYIRFEVNGKTHGLSELCELIDEWWYVLDSAIIHVSGSQLQLGEDYEVEVTLALRPPYIPGFTRMTQCTKTLRAH